jgi:hypothetical protein
VTVGSTQRRHVRFREELAERGIRWRWPSFNSKCIREQGVVAANQVFQITQALAMAEDSLNSHHQQQLARRNSNPLPHPDIQKRMEAVDETAMGCDGRATGHREEGIRPTSTDARSLGKNA